MPMGIKHNENELNGFRNKILTSNEIEFQFLVSTDAPCDIFVTGIWIELLGQQ